MIPEGVWMRLALVCACVCVCALERVRVSVCVRVCVSECVLCFADACSIAKKSKIATKFAPRCRQKYLHIPSSVQIKKNKLKNKNNI
jgi:hypothetical protein